MARSRDKNTNPVKPAAVAGYDSLLTDIARVIEDARHAAARAVNAIMTTTSGSWVAASLNTNGTARLALITGASGAGRRIDKLTQICPTDRLAPHSDCGFFQKLASLVRPSPYFFGR
jgi:hypothetical protein